jgi:hypothetical protein
MVKIMPTATPSKDFVAVAIFDVVVVVVVVVVVNAVSSSGDAVFVDGGSGGIAGVVSGEAIVTLTEVIG